MNYAAAQVVESQPREGLPYGLFSSFTFRTSGDDHWQNGIEWEALTCEPAEVMDPDCADPVSVTFSGYATSERGTAPGIVVTGSQKCSVPGGRADLQAQEKATAHLLSREEGAVETSVWTRLAAATGLVTLTGVSSVGAAIAELEQYAGETWGSRSIIHASRKAASLAGDSLHRAGQRLYTNLETQIVAGGGYSASPLTLYVTPALFGYRSPVYPTTLVDPHLNDAYALAQRHYVVGWDPCPIAAITVA